MTRQLILIAVIRTMELRGSPLAVSLIAVTKSSCRSTEWSDLRKITESNGLMTTIRAHIYLPPGLSSLAVGPVVGYT